jgi:uncharacterized membrane protein HdeD (DUF308 family)
MAMRTATLTGLRHNWGWLALRGAVFVVFGILALLWPDLTLAALVLVWGVTALADGVLALICAFSARDERGMPFRSLLVVGLLGMLAGALTLLWPGISALVLLLLIAGWALAMGIFQIAAAIRLRRALEHDWLLALSGALSVVFGALIFFNPGAGALTLIWVIGLYAILFGSLLIAFALQLRGASGRPLAGAVGRR